MTTPTTQQRVAVVDDVGVLALISPSYAADAVKRGEVQRTERADVFKLNARRSAMRQLTPAERRALVLKKARGQR